MHAASFIWVLRPVLLDSALTTAFFEEEEITGSTALRLDEVMISN